MIQSGRLSTCLSAGGRCGRVVADRATAARDRSLDAGAARGAVPLGRVVPALPLADGVVDFLAGLICSPRRHPSYPLAASRVNARDAGGGKHGSRVPPRRRKRHPVQDPRRRGTARPRSAPGAQRPARCPGWPRAGGSPHARKESMSACRCRTVAGAARSARGRCGSGARTVAAPGRSASRLPAPATGTGQPASAPVEARETAAAQRFVCHGD
jgi:hypothetical protein